MQSPALTGVMMNIIDRLLADPRRIVAIRNKLNLGKSVRFMDWRTGQMRTGKIVAIKHARPGRGQ
ncbi:hypothetical protein [Variovorax sp. OV700]|uniref:hypothetical protein n=1 Tax=Variovorax sp. OV700 TaxID=1882826 RepID=UPI00088CB0CB|nr:hypothetical protein [Variovorax sp. OV700]SDH84354.1 hypothetical protein SAMN05444748_102619 [Variovorax sp. OV700]